MKKAITILAILIVLVSAVFADTVENHKLKVTTEVKEYVPVFQLYFSNNVKTNDSRNTPRTAPNTAAGEDFTNKDAESAYTDTDVIDKTAIDISQQAVSATVTAKLTGNVKLGAAKTYELQFKADSLKSDHTHVMTIGQAAVYHYIAPSTANSSIAAATGENLDDGITMGNPSALAVSNGVLSGTINATMDTSNIQPCDLASFTFNYPANDAAPVDTYEAYIWLTVSAS